MMRKRSFDEASGGVHPTDERPVYTLVIPELDDTILKFVRTFGRYPQKVKVCTTEEQRMENELAEKISKKRSELLPKTRKELEPYRFRSLSHRVIAGLKQEPLMTSNWRIEGVIIAICAMVRDGSAAISTLMLWCGQHLSFSRELSIQ